MKKYMITGLILSLLSVATAANELSERNLVKRSLTLKHGEIFVGAIAVYGETGKKDDTGLGVIAAYGITDDLSLSFYDVRYRLLARDNDNYGLELTVGVGMKPGLQRQNVDVEGYSADITGKYVVANDLALYFGTEYVKWDHDKDSQYDASEMRYGVGASYQVIPHLTWSVGYAYRDLKDFVQNNAYTISTGINYAWSKSTDIGIVYEYTDFDAVKNGFELDGFSSFKRNFGAYVGYRF